VKERERGGAYAAAGVDIDEQERGLGQIKTLVRSTFDRQVLSDLGSFGGLFRPDLTGYVEPVLVSSADGVGTKLRVAQMAGDYSTVGVDLVNHCVNDILVQGARPLFFLDYVGAGKLEAERLVQLVEGLVVACRENGCALLGGETAEMPGFYRVGDYELVGFIVGVVDRPRLLDGSRIEPGDLLLGLPSSGLHTNGYSLARRVLFERRGLTVEDAWEEGGTIGEILLRPHRSYLRALEGLLGHAGLHGLAHITGGGLTDNLPRILPPGLRAEVDLGSWRVPLLFRRIAEWGGVGEAEMLRVFIQGVGMVMVIGPSDADAFVRHLAGHGLEATVVGVIQAGGSGVNYLGSALGGLA
jgi:phosphoribosylformylglycinamidine cyclo-ligase